MINVVSLTPHRVDVKFAHYIASCLMIKVGLYDSTDYLIVTNGMIDNANPEVLEKMKQVKSLYLNDDWECWIPPEKDYPLCTVLTQFKDRPYQYFQISKLALFDMKFSRIVKSSRLDLFINWGAYRPERHELYKKFPADTVCIGKRYPDEFNSWQMLPFTKDMNDLHRTLMNHSGYSTHYFGNPGHNGISISYRLYEALMCGIFVEVDEESIGDLDLDIQWITDYLDSKSSYSTYIFQLQTAREKIRGELNGFISR